MQALQVWLLIALMTLVIGPLFWLVHRASCYYRYHGADKHGLAHLGNCFW